MELSPEKKLRISEAIYLLLVGIISPFFSGMEIWGSISFTAGLIFVNILQLPSIVLFYRWLLPVTLMRGQIWQFVLLFPAYLLIYELNSRLASVITIHAPFLVQNYRNLLISVQDELWTWNFNQNLGYTCLVLLTASSLAMMRSMLRQQEHVFRVNLEKVKLELDHLKSQVQPHFFFNTLNNLYALSVQKSDKAPVMIANLSGIMRYVLYDSQREKIGLDKELHFLKNYVDLEKLRHTNPDAIDIYIQGEPEGKDIAPLLFLPLIENAFKHAQPKETGNMVKIMIAIDAEEVTFQTTNQPKLVKGDGPGGIGLANVKKRLELLYAGKYNLFIDHTPEKFDLVLTLKY